jgi:UDP-2,4-diacetamido-2,4,6-trideoxy-beta-L-altropyranose hydrolase
MRCLALAQAWKDAGGDVTFITACRNEGLLQWLRDEEFDIKLLTSAYPDTADWNFTEDVLSGRPGAWVVLDGYHFDEVYQRQIKQAGHPLLVVDDNAHLKHYCADILVNQNLHAEQLRYSCEPYTRLLLGARYALLRREFLSRKQERQREIPEVARHVLVTLGGGDSENVTLKVVHALREVNVSGLEAIVVIGASNPHTEELEAAARQSRIPICLVHNARDMAALMAWADVAVAASGSTFWELAFMGVPSLVFVLADNQRYLAAVLGKLGLAVVLPGCDNSSLSTIVQEATRLLERSEIRAEMVLRSQELVDGEGVKRVIGFLR